LDGLLVLEVELKPGLGDGHVVAVGQSGRAGDELPVVGLAHGLHSVSVFGLVELIGGGEVAVIERGPGPDAAIELARAVSDAEVLAGLGELPVGDLEDGFFDGGRLDGRRKVFSERAGVVGVGAEHAGVIAGDGCDAGGLGVWGGGGSIREAGRGGDRRLGECKRSAQSEREQSRAAKEHSGPREISVNRRRMIVRSRFEGQGAEEVSYGCKRFERTIWTAIRGFWTHCAVQNDASSDDYSSRRTSRGFWPRVRWEAIQPVKIVRAAAMASAARLTGILALKVRFIGVKRSKAQAMKLANNRPTAPATRPRTANSIEKMVAIRARVAPRVLRTTTSRMRRYRVPAMAEARMMIPAKMEKPERN